jgi:hypothetical protein
MNQSFDKVLVTGGLRFIGSHIVDARWITELKLGYSICRQAPGKISYTIRRIEDFIW